MKVFRDIVYLGFILFYVYGDYKIFEDEFEEYLELKIIKIIYGYL